MAVDTFADNYITSLASGVSGAATAMTPTTTSGHPTADPTATPPSQFRCLVENEIVTVTDARSTPWTCTAFAGAHGAGTVVAAIVSTSALGQFVQQGGTKIGNLMDVTLNGVKGDGSTDDSAAMSAVHATAALYGARPYYPGNSNGTMRTYKINSIVTMPAHCKAVGAGRDLVTIDGTGLPSIGTDGVTGATITGAMFTSTGGALTGTTTNLTGNASPLAYSVAVTSGASFAAGDYVRLESTASTGGDGIKAGEVLRIFSVVSNTVTFDTTVCGTYLTADTAKITKLTMIDGIEVEGFNFLGTTNRISKVSAGVEVAYCLNALVTKCRFTYCHLYGVYNNSSLFTNVHDNDFETCASFVWGYAVCHNGAAQDAYVSGNSFRNCKTAVEHTGSTSSGNGGVARRCTFHGNHIYGSYKAAMQAHTGAEDLTFSFNTVWATSENSLVAGTGESAAQCDGMNAHGSRMVITGNTFHGMYRRMIYCSNDNVAGTRLEITDNVCKGSALGHTYGAGIELDLSKTTGPTESVLISGNTIFMDQTTNSRAAINVFGPSGTTPMVQITGNNVYADGANPGIRVEKLKGFVINGNIIYVPSASSAAGIQFSSASSNGSVSGNTIIGANTGSTSNAGILAADTTDVACTGNAILGFYNPVKTTGTSNRWAVSGNAITQFNAGGAATSLTGANNQTTGANA